MTNWKWICKNCLDSCLCLGSRKKKDEEKVEEVSANEASNNNLEDSEISKAKDSVDAKNKINVQEWLDQNYPKEEREKVTKLHIWDKKLEGKLDLSDFINLEELDCTNNCLIKLVLPRSSINLRKLNLVGNDFSPQDLSFLVSATNLEILVLGNWDWKVIAKTNQYNRFTGSLDYLTNMRQLKILNINDTDLNEVNTDKLPSSLEEIYYSRERPSCKLTEITHQLEEYEWKDLHLDFTLKKRREWERVGFNKEKTREWIKVGLEPKDYNFVHWLSSIKNFSLQWVLKNKNSNRYEKLRERCNTFDWCCQCQQPNDSKKWCQPCAEKEWKKDLENLAETELVEKFIKQQQLRGSEKEESQQRTLKWIPYEGFSDIRYLTEGGFSKIYEAKYEIEEWEKSIHTFPFKEKKVKKTKAVVLKSLTSSQNITLDFFQEIANIKLVDSNFSIVTCYGISRDPITKNYIIVMEYVEDGNLRQFLQQKFRELNWEDKIIKLFRIAEGLGTIHSQGLIHCDFHMGNILNVGETIRITDLGLSRPVNETNKNKVYGVLPYVAPEILRGEFYTQTSDIYSFGIVAYEFLSNAYPYINADLDNVFVLQVCKGLRPDLNRIRIPQLLEDLIVKCWDGEPLNRPKAVEITNVLWDFLVSSEFAHQTKEIDRSLSEEIKFSKYEIHHKAVYHSRLINTSQITDLLQKSKEVNEQSYNASQPIEFDIDKLDSILKKDHQEQSSAQIQIPPK